MRLFGLTIVLCVASAASAETFYASASSFSGPNPAVVRIVAPERDGTSYGSGALVAVNESSGLVLTNWHVVRDAAGPIVVYFPDGFRSGAYLLRTDRDWDLAALAIRRPNVPPIAIAREAPKPGEELTIAGYGSGSYRSVTGRLTQYYSPGGNQPSEILELSAPARNGDSGGPILNRRGELAGTLFGTAFGRTMGSYCGRLLWFVNSVDGDFRRISSQAMLAQQSRRDAPTASINSGVPAANQNAPAATNPVGQLADDGPFSSPWQRPGNVTLASNQAPMNNGSVPQRSGVHRSTLPPEPERIGRVVCENTGARVSASAAQPRMSPVAAIPTTSGESQSRADLIKSVLALVGVIAVLYQALRFLGWAIG